MAGLENGAKSVEVCGLVVHCIVDRVLSTAGQALGCGCIDRLNRGDHTFACRMCQRSAHGALHHYKLAACISEADMIICSCFILCSCWHGG